MRYRTTKCPNCGYILEFNESTAKDTIGPPKLPCPSCGNYYLTGAKFWQDFDSSEKIFYIIKNIFFGLYTALFYSIWVFLLAAALQEFFNIEVINYIIFFIGLFILSVIIFLILIIRRQIALIKYSEDDFKRDLKNM